MAFGAAIMYVCLNSFKDKILILYIAGVVILSAWEFLVGISLEKIFRIKYWDYSHMKLSFFSGRLCLRNCLLWGVFGTLFIKIIHPVLENVIIDIPFDMLLGMEVLALIIFIVDVVSSIIRVKDINIGMDELIEVTDGLEVKRKHANALRKKLNKHIVLSNSMHKFKVLTSKVNNRRKESLSSLINKLKKKQDILKEGLNNRMSRLRFAFPNMKLERVGRLLNKKIDIIGILKNDSRNTKKDKK